MSEEIKSALRMMPYGFYAVSSKFNENENIMVANWIMQIAFEPRTIGFGLAKSAYSHELIEKGGVFAVNMFSKDNAEEIKLFTKSREKNPHKMKVADYTPGAHSGCPILVKASAYIECRVIQIVDFGGDHDMVIGKVIGGGVHQAGDTSDTLTLPDLGWSYAG